MSVLRLTRSQAIRAAVLALLAASTLAAAPDPISLPPPAASTTSAARPGARSGASRPSTLPPRPRRRACHGPRSSSSATARRRPRSELDDARDGSSRRRSARARCRASGSSCRSGSAPLLYLRRALRRRRRAARADRRGVGHARARRARARARLVGDRARSPGAVAAGRRTRVSIYVRIASGWSRSCAATRRPRRPATGSPRRRAPPAISIARGRRRPPPGSAPRSAATAASRCAPISTSSSTQAIIPDKAARLPARERRAGRHHADRGLGSLQEESGNLEIWQFGNLTRFPNYPITRFPDQLFASFQFSPTPTSTVTGTFNATADFHQLTHGGGGFVGGLLRRLEQQLVVDGEDHARAAAGDGRERGVDVDHRLLQDVGRRALDRHVDGGAFGGGADLAVAVVQIGHQAAPAEHRLHRAGLRRASSSMPSMNARTDGKPAK